MSRKRLCYKLESPNETLNDDRTSDDERRKTKEKAWKARAHARMQALKGTERTIENQKAGSER